jgi:hypothetical protein
MRRVERWAHRLRDADFVLAPQELDLHQRDQLRIAIDSQRGEGLSILLRALYRDIAPELADRAGVPLLAIDSLQLDYDLHFRRVHADALALAGKYRIKVSADLVNILTIFNSGGYRAWSSWARCGMPES